jgi:hypothetical protein
MNIKYLNKYIKFLFFITIFIALSVELCSQTYFFSNEYVKGHFKLQKLNKDSLKVIGEIVNKKPEIIVVTPPEGYYGKVGSNAIDLFLGYDNKSTFNSPLEFKEIAPFNTIRFDYYLLGHISSRIKWITISISYAFMEDIKDEIFLMHNVRYIMLHDYFIKNNWLKFSTSLCIE